MKILRRLLFALLLSVCAYGQAAPFALMPVPYQCFTDTNGNPLAGGKLYFFAAGTSSPQATYTDYLGGAQNTNPVLLNTSGCANIWFGPVAYKVTLTDSADVQQWSYDHVSDVGQLLYGLAVLLNPSSTTIPQTINGVLAASYFQGNTVHTTSPGVRVALLDPNTQVDTLNPPTITTLPPANGGQVYKVPDPGPGVSSFVLNPNSDGSNTLDCTQAGVKCLRQVNIELEGASCNNTTASLGFDTFATNAPVPICVTGANIQKGVMAFPSAVTMIQQSSGAATGANTAVATYANATVTGNASIIVITTDGTTTVSGCTDGTNAFTQTIHVANGTLSVDIWHKFNQTGVAAATSVTCTLAAAATANIAMELLEYSGLITTGGVNGAKDTTAPATGTGTAVSVGPTIGTAQNTELIIVGVGSTLSNLATAANGWTQHNFQNSTTNVSVNGEGLIQQATTTQSGTMTLASAAPWAAAIATFKANVGGIIQGQRQFILPGTFYGTFPIIAAMKWQSPQHPTGTADAALFTSILCTADGNTDDSVFSNGSLINASIPNSVSNVLTTTTFTVAPSNASPCAPGNQMHVQVGRQRYTAGDTYEGYIYMNTLDMLLGVSE